jgi:hypothetical protein
MIGSIHQGQFCRARHQFGPRLLAVFDILGSGLFVVSCYTPPGTCGGLQEGDSLIFQVESFRSYVEAPACAFDALDLSANQTWTMLFREGPYRRPRPDICMPMRADIAVDNGWTWSPVDPSVFVATVYAEASATSGPCAGKYEAAFDSPGDQYFGLTAQPGPDTMVAEVEFHYTPTDTDPSCPKACTGVLHGMLHRERPAE